MEVRQQASKTTTQPKTTSRQPNLLRRRPPPPASKPLKPPPTISSISDLPLNLANKDVASTWLWRRTSGTTKILMSCLSMQKSWPMVAKPEGFNPYIITRLVLNQTEAILTTETQHTNNVKATCSNNNEIKQHVYNFQTTIKQLIMLLLNITIAAAEAAIGPAIVSSIYRNRKSTRINQSNLLNK
ncbi:hypothetical protein F8388_025063 [Cannabis sativa]|uniref:Uncharacterized protein n=1 Tax=Cannabis sativa TaxID=3483 RepID=A0A7J6FIZ0_CANSA|nr:hypothetical protein F8388_025063 [Cannabis sativa]